MTEPGRLRRAARSVGGLDRRTGAVEAMRRIRRALPGDPGFGDPLSAAGRDGAATIARVADRLFDEQPRVSREAGLGALQVWQSVLERTGRGRGDLEMTVLFTDLVDFSDWALKVGDDDALRLLRAVATALEPPMLSHRGRIVKRLGDGLMVAFPAPQLAFDAVVAARQRLTEVEVAGHRPRLRAGLHTGRPRQIGGDIVGVDVNVAARLGDAASADEILVSATTLAGLDRERVTTRRKKTFAFRTIKGVPTDLAVYVAAPVATPKSS